MHRTEMNDRHDEHVNQELLSPEVRPHKRKWRVRARTFIVPLLFMLLHFAVMNLTMFARIAIYFMTVDPATAIMLQGKMTDPAFYVQFMIEINAQTYSSLFAMLILIPLYLLYAHWQKKRGIQVLDRARLSPAHIISALVITVGAIGLTQLWMVFLSQLDPTSAIGTKFQEYTELMKYFEPSGGWVLVLEIMTTVILVPIGEELLFRGIIQDELRRAFPPGFAIVATSLLFAIFHGNVIQASYVLFVGLALSIVYYLTGNIYVPIGMHIVFNLIGSGVFSRLLGLSQRGETVLMYVLFASIPLMVAGFVRLYRLRAKRLLKGG